MIYFSMKFIVETEERPDWNLLNTAIGDFIEGFNVIYKSQLEEPIPFCKLTWFQNLILSIWGYSVYSL